MDRIFDFHIEKLKTKLIKMCSLVDEQVDFAIKSVEEQNLELADLVIKRDKYVDKYDVKIERICQKLFALNQPVAMDLRLVMSALKINNNLERIGDLAVNIAYQSKDLKSLPDYFEKLHYSEIVFLAKDMIKKAIDAFITNNSELVRVVIKTDDKLDDLVKHDSKYLIELMHESKENINSAILFYQVFQEIERLGDHATNIAEEVFFIVKAQLIKHRKDLEDQTN